MIFRLPNSMGNNWLQEREAQIARRENIDRRMRARCLVARKAHLATRRSHDDRRTVDGGRWTTDDEQRAP